MGQTEGGARKPFLELHQKLFVFLLSFLLAFMAEGLDTLGVSTAHDTQTVQLSSVLGFFSAPPIYEEARHPVTVFLIDQSSRKRIDFDTPFLPYGSQADYIYYILGLDPEKPEQTRQGDLPAAIFLDLIYTRDDSDPEGLSRLTGAIEMARKLGVTVYTGPIVDTGHMQAFSAAAEQVSVNWTFEHPLDYPFKGLAAYNPDSADQQHTNLTAAARIYYDLCQRDDPLSRPENGGTCNLYRASPKNFADHEPMFLTYLPQPAKVCGTCRSTFPAIAGAVMPHFSTPEKLQSARKPLDVTYLSLADIARPRPTGVILDEEVHKTYIAGKVVMIGDGLGNDTLTVPVFGVVDGVMQHALALQSLLSVGQDYMRWPRQLEIPFKKGRFEIGVDFLIEWAIALVSLLIAQAVIYMRSSILGRSRPYVIFASVTLLPLLLAFLIWWQLRSNHWPMFNIFSIMLATGGLFSIVELDKILSKRWTVLFGSLAMGMGLALLGLAGLYGTL